MNTVVIIVLVILVLAAVGFIFFAYSTSGQSSFTQANGTVSSGATRFSKLGTPWSAEVPMSCKGTVDCSVYNDNFAKCMSICSGWSEIQSTGKTSCDTPRFSCSSKTTEASCTAVPGCSWS